MKIGKLEISKKLLITLIVVIVLAISVLIIEKIVEKDYNNYKIDKDKEFIYTYETYDDSDTDIPYININTDFVNKLNKSIQELGLSYKTSTTANISMNYQYAIDDNVVSLVIIFKKLNEKDQLVFDFMTYVFDLEQEGKVLTDSEILKAYNITTDEVNEEIELQMVKKYDDEINKGILPETCSYLECFKKLRNVNKYTDNAHYLINDGELVVFTNYNVYSEYKEEEYFTRDDFKFYIK